tara:strand:+ start:212 stop:469 length:258 start_codon:yes stop_codon:yes gene_type:complete
MTNKINNKEIDKKVIECLKKTFPKTKFKKKIHNLKMGDIEKWDSIGNLNLIFEVEKSFKVRFKAKDFNKIISIKDIIHYIKKLSK